MFNWFKKLFGFGNELVSVKPLDAPSGELSYVDVVYQTEDKVGLDLTGEDTSKIVDWCGGSMEYKYVEPVKEETSIVYEKDIFLITTDGVPNVENFEIPVGNMTKTEALEQVEELIEEYKKEVVLPIEEEGKPKPKKKTTKKKTKKGDI